MKKSKLMVATSLACLLDVSLVCGETCNASGYYACFKYNTEEVDPKGEKRDWTSYKKSKTHESVFGSLDGFDGQYVPKGEKTSLGIANNRSTLMLDAINTVASKNPWNFGLYVDVGSGGSLKSYSIYGLIVSGIYVTNSHQNKIKEEGKKSVSLEFKENGTLNYYDLKKDDNRNMYYSNTVRNLEVPLAWLGGVWNDSGSEVSLKFDGGARMMGDVYVEGEGSKNTLIFDGKDGILGFFKNRFSFSAVFEGGIHSSGGKNVFDINEGDVIAESAMGDWYGIKAENGGKNSLVFGGGGLTSKAQSLHSRHIIATTSKGEGDSENTITFKNTSVGNVITVGDMYAENGKNTIQTKQGGKANLEVENKIVAQGEKTSQNTVALDGGATFGRMLLVNANAISDAYGIVAQDGGNNTILLKDTSKNEEIENYKKTLAYLGVESNKMKYEKQRVLATTGVFASGGGTNNLDVDGDFVLLYSNGSGGKVVATSGGKNYIESNGGFFAVGYGKPSDVLLTRITNVRKDYDVGRGASDSSIIAYGRDSENSVGIKNVGEKEGNLGGGNRNLFLGSIEAYGGSNHIALYGSGGKGVQIRRIVAGGGNSFDVENIGGTNNISVVGGKKTTIQDIITDWGGKNNLLFYSNGGDKSDVEITNLAYSEGGETLFYFSGIKTNGYLSENGLGLRLKDNPNDQTLSLRVTSSSSGRGSRNKYDICVMSGTFWGNTEYDFLDGESSKSTTTKVNYWFGGGSVFVGNIGGYTRDMGNTNGSLTLQSNSKFILKNEGKTSFETLILTQSSSSSGDLLQDTIKLPTTTLDLATNGESFSQFSRGTQGKTLDVGTMVINMGDLNGSGGSPLLRLYVAGTREGQADNLKVKKFVGNGTSGKGKQFETYKTIEPSDKELKEKVITNLGTSLNVQIFLPTELIGTDFTGKGVTILSVESGGEDLKVDSKKAQTGFTTYWVEITKQEFDKNSTTSTTTTTNSPSDSSKPHRWVLGKTMEASINKDSLGLAGSLLTNNHSNWTMMLNSLNKRMGELRNNPYTHGVWGRIFGGEQTSSHGYAKIDSGYVTLQAGYDYAFFIPSSWGEATLYVGGALSYGFMSSKSQEFMGNDLLYAPYAYNAYSHSLELGIYAVYLYDCGLYLDSILKWGFITTDFRGINAHSSQANITNYHITLGEEIGYRFSLGKNKEWSITPQLEVIFGYLSESEAKQEYDGQTLHSILEGVPTLRTRIGSDFGYALKYKNQTYDFQFGASYEVDYANADASYGILGATYLDRVSENALISTDQRMVLDLGVNVLWNEKTRFYCNLESSFFGKVNTKYEINLGVRYSFGEKKTTQIQNKEKIQLPLRVGG